MRETFKSIAYKILESAPGPLRSDEITRQALRRGFAPDGKTPAATMAAVLYVDINTKGDRSLFVQTAPATFALNPKQPKGTSLGAALEEAVYPLSAHVSPRQKGDIAEGRVAELIALYGRKPLSSYKPISDDEGIDLVVKQKNALGWTVCLQIKSQFAPRAGKLFAANTKPPAARDGNLAFVFCYFDTDEGDLWKYLWFIPADKFLARAPELATGQFAFRATMNPSGTTRGGRPLAWSEFLIDKRGLADAILRLMATPRPRG